jgi:hypothetical protein
MYWRGAEDSLLSVCIRTQVVCDLLESLASRRLSILTTRVVLVDMLAPQQIGTNLEYCTKQRIQTNISAWDVHWYM